MSEAGNIIKGYIEKLQTELVEEVARRQRSEHSSREAGILGGQVGEWKEISEDTRETWRPGAREELKERKVISAETEKWVCMCPTRFELSELHTHPYECVDFLRDGITKLRYEWAQAASSLLECHNELVAGHFCSMAGRIRKMVKETGIHGV